MGGLRTKNSVTEKSVAFLPFYEKTNHGLAALPPTYHGLEEKSTVQLKTLERLHRNWRGKSQEKIYKSIFGYLYLLYIYTYLEKSFCFS